MSPEKDVRQRPSTMGVRTRIRSRPNIAEYGPNNPAGTPELIMPDGLSVACWVDGACLEDRYRDSPFRSTDENRGRLAALGALSRERRADEGMENLDLLVVVDVFPSVASVLPDYEDGPPVLLLPASSQYEHYRSLTNTNRSVQWSEPVRSPAHNSKPDLQIMQDGRLSGFGEHSTGARARAIQWQVLIRGRRPRVQLGTNTIGYRQTANGFSHIWVRLRVSSEDLKGVEGTTCRGRMDARL